MFSVRTLFSLHKIICLAASSYRILSFSEKLYILDWPGIGHWIEILFVPEPGPADCNFVYKSDVK